MIHSESNDVTNIATNITTFTTIYNNLTIGGGGSASAINSDQSASSSAAVPLTRIVVTTVYAALCLVGYTNLFIITAVLNTQRLRHSSTNILILNLSMADLLLISSIPFALCLQWMKTWIFGLQTCRFYWTIEQSNKYASVIFITVLSYHRYIGVCRPAASGWTQSKSFSVTIVLMGWASVMLILVPAIWYTEILTIGDRHLCVIKWPHNYSLDNVTTISLEELVYTSCSFSIFYLTPVLLILVFYTLVGLKLKKLTRNRRNLFSTASPHAASTHHRFNSQYKRITYMILAVGSFHLFCWTPYWILNILAVSGQINFGYPWLRNLYNFIHMLPYLNSAANPVFYGVMNPQYRSFFFILCPRKSGPDRDKLMEPTNLYPAAPPSPRSPLIPKPPSIANSNDTIERLALLSIKRPKSFEVKPLTITSNFEQRKSKETAMVSENATPLMPAELSKGTVM